jgi:hypothetical protein
LNHIPSTTNVAWGLKKQETRQLSLEERLEIDRNVEEMLKANQRVRAG